MLKNNQSNPFYGVPNKSQTEKGVSPLKREKPKFWIWTSFGTKNKPQNKSKTRFFTLDKNIQGFFPRKTNIAKVGILNIRK